MIIVLPESVNSVQKTGVFFFLFLRLLLLLLLPLFEKTKTTVFFQIPVFLILKFFVFLVE